MYSGNGQVGMSTPEWKSVDLEHGRCIVASRLENCKPSGSQLEICQVDMKIVSRREVNLRFVKST